MPLPPSNTPGGYGTQHHAVCIDGPLVGGNYALHATKPIVWLGSRLDQPYRPVQEEGTGVWYYVYADAIEDDPPITLSHFRHY